jgi:poly-gamma-glutamate capsule biosynthesis protein CapA/YwtB (metallophosphatase superfamily)
MAARNPTSKSVTRRAVLNSAASLPLLLAAGCGVLPARSRANTGITLTGQALMKHPLCADPYPGLVEVVAELARNPVVFTDLEIAIRTAESGAPTRDTEFFHAATPEVLECLRAMQFNLLALSNNHAWDLGTAGVLATRNAVRKAGFAAAGSGRNVSEATAAGELRTGNSTVALVSMATEKIRDGAAATDERAGINELRLDGSGEPHANDATRNLQAIRQAKGRADIVIAYHHNHDWGDNMAITRPWSQNWARQCIDAGASIYVSHGAPLLHGIEIYRGFPIFYGLGSLVFHSITAPGHYPPEVWESAIVHCAFEGDRLAGLEVVPIVTNEMGDDPARQNETRGRPRIARGAAAERILGRLAHQSAAWGTELRVNEGRGWLER